MPRVHLKSSDSFCNVPLLTREGEKHTDLSSVHLDIYLSTLREIDSWAVGPTLKLNSKNNQEIGNSQTKATLRVFIRVLTYQFLCHLASRDVSETATSGSGSE